MLLVVAQLEVEPDRSAVASWLGVGSAQTLSGGSACMSPCVSARKVPLPRPLPREKIPPMFPGDRSARCPTERMRLSSCSYCSWVLGIWWSSGWSRDIARWLPTPRARKSTVVRSWKLGRSKPTDWASRRAISNRVRVRSIRSPDGTVKSMRRVPEVSWRSSSRCSNFMLRMNMMYVTGSVWTPSMSTP